MGRMFQIDVTGNVAGVVTLPKQLKFAAAKSINDTGKFAQQEVIRELGDELVLRGNWYQPKTRYGINFTNAKFSSDNAEGVLFTRADWLLAEEGFNRGIKRPIDGEHLADPEDPVTRGAITNKFPVAQKARRLLAASQGRVSPKTGKLIGATGAFIIKPKDKPGIEYIFQRVGINPATGQVKVNKKGIPLRGRVKGNRSRLVLKHILKEQVKVPRHMIVLKTSENTYKVWYGEYYGRNIRLALRTAR